MSEHTGVYSTPHPATCKTMRTGSTDDCDCGAEPIEQPKPKNYPWLVGYYRQAIVIAIEDSKHRDLESIIETLQRTLDYAEKHMTESAPEVSRARIETT